MLSLDLLGSCLLQWITQIQKWRTWFTCIDWQTGKACCIYERRFSDRRISNSETFSRIYRHFRENATFTRVVKKINASHFFSAINKDWKVHFWGLETWCYSCVVIELIFIVILTLMASSLEFSRIARSRPVLSPKWAAEVVKGRVVCSSSALSFSRWIKSGKLLLLYCTKIEKSASVWKDVKINVFCC